MSTWGGTLGSGRHFGSGTMLTCSRDYVLRCTGSARCEKQADIKTERRKAIEAAQDFCYGEEVVEALRNAETTSELTRILLNARIRSCEA